MPTYKGVHGGRFEVVSLPGETHVEVSSGPQHNVHAPRTIPGSAIVDLRDLEAFVDRFGWTLLSEQAPDSRGVVLFSTEGGTVGCGIMQDDGTWGVETFLGRVTHWRPLPLPPSG